MLSRFFSFIQNPVPKEEKVWARRSHLTTLLTYPLALLPFPFTWEVLGVMVFPFAVWLSRDKKSFSARQSLEALYLQAILSFGYIGFWNAFSHDRVLIVFSYGFVVFLHLVLVVLATVKVSLGVEHKYPFSFIPYLFRSNQAKENWREIRKQFSDKDQFQEFRGFLERLDNYKAQIVFEVDEITDPDLRSQGRTVIESMASLRASLTENPANFRTARQYLNYFPETTAELLKKYNSISRAGAVGGTPNGSTTNTGNNTAGDHSHASGGTARTNPVEEKRNANLRNLLQEIQTTTDQVRAKILSSETMALDVEIQAMKKNIDYGGY